MPIAENFAERLTYKIYTATAITPGSEPVPATDPGASGGQTLRHVSQTLSLTRDAFQSNEKRTDRQAPMSRLGTRRAPGQITGLLSPLTYKDPMAAVLRGTWAAGVTLTETDLTSIAADNGASTITAGGGDPVALGLKVGDQISFTDLSEANNNSVYFTILSFGGTSNRTMTVYPAPTTMSADSAFTLVSAQSLIIPASSHVSRLFAFEVYNSEIDIHRLFTECRLGAMNLSLPPNDNAQIDFSVLGRNRVIASGASSPFFTAPGAITTTDICAAVDGLLRVDGTNQGVVTALTIAAALNPQGPSVVGTNLVPEIFLGNAQVTGEFSVFLQDSTFLDYLDAESEVELLTLLPTGNAQSTHRLSVYLPRIKVLTNDEQDDGSGGKIVRCSFAAAPYAGATAGVTPSTMRIVDTAVT